MNIADDIVISLHEEMKKYIKVSNGYRTNPNIFFGAFSPEEVETFPAIGFDVIDEDFDTVYQNNEGMGFISFDIYGYVYSDGIDRISDIRNISHDVLHFIMNDFSYTDDVEITDKLQYSGYKTLAFKLPIRVNYEYTGTTIK